MARGRVISLNSAELLGVVASVLVALLLQIARKHVGAEAQRLGLVDHLLVHAGLRAAHNDVVLLRIDFGVEPRIADEVNDPELCFLLTHVELVGEHRNVDALVNATVRLKDEEASALNELILQWLQEVICAEQAFALAQLLLGTVEVIIHQETLHELSDRIAICVVLLLDDAHQILEHVSPPWICNHGGCEVSEHVRAIRLDRLHVAL